MEENAQHEIIACMSCMAPNDALADFCEKCGAPLSTMSTLDPLKIIRSEGFVIHKSTVTKRPKFIIFFGVWVLFIPWLVMSLATAYSAAFYLEGFFGFVFFWVGFALAVFAVVVLYRVTKNYYAKPVGRQNEGK